MIEDIKSFDNKAVRSVFSFVNIRPAAYFFTLIGSGMAVMISNWIGQWSVSYVGV